MKTLLLTLFACFLVTGMAVQAMTTEPGHGTLLPKVGDIKVKVYGSGGVVVVGDTQKVCPNKDAVTCADITIPQSIVVGGNDLDLDGLEGVLNYQGALNRIRIVSGTATSDANGSEGDYKAEGRNLSFIYLH